MPAIPLPSLPEAAKVICVALAPPRATGWKEPDWPERLLLGFRQRAFLVERIGETNGSRILNAVEEPNGQGSIHALLGAIRREAPSRLHEACPWLRNLLEQEVPAEELWYQVPENAVLAVPTADLPGILKREPEGSVHVMRGWKGFYAGERILRFHAEHPETQLLGHGEYVVEVRSVQGPNDTNPRTERTRLVHHQGRALVREDPNGERR